MISSQSWMRTLFVGGVAALYLSTREDPKRIARLLDRSGLDLGLDVANTYGAGLLLGAGSLAVMTAGWWSDSPYLRRLGSDLSSSLLLSGSVVWALKLGVGARRPDGGPHSFPSGHTAAAFAVAPVLQRHFGSRIGTPAYILAGLTGLARMEDSRHFLADVAFGAAIGIAAGQLVNYRGLLGIEGTSFHISPLGLKLGISF
jgi:membrane-associated phospholipid phosphatase